MKNDIMVSVLCTAYNHEKYIRDALNGILKQKTNFRYEVIVHDDASTDRTADIVLEYANKYPDMIRPLIEKENLNTCNLRLLYPYVKGKYIAICEGDDYWTDEQKLQIQVDFMEKHPEYGMTMHNAVKLHDTTGDRRMLNTFAADGCYSQEQHVLAGLGSDFPAYASYVIRTDMLKKMPAFFYEAGVMDYPLRQYYANCAKIYYFAQPMSVYRVAVENSYMNRTSRKEDFYNNYTLNMLAFFEKFGEYTQHRFDQLLRIKIDSDYLGFCTSIDEDRGLKKAIQHGLNIAKIQKCFRQLEMNYVANSILSLTAKSEHIFIYGTSRLGMLCKKQLDHAGIVFDGFVVSDNQIKNDVLDGKPVFYVSEIKNRFGEAGFILAVQPINREILVNVLESQELYNYCAPYGIEDASEAM